MRTNRYGFNGKENDNEVKGVEGSQQDYGMRIYDPRIGRFLSVDPITKSYPELTPYQFASNTPIWAIDLDGLEGAIANPGQMMNMPGIKQYEQFAKSVGEWWGQSSETSTRLAKGWFGASNISANDANYTNGDAVAAFAGASGTAMWQYYSGGGANLLNVRSLGRTHSAQPQSLKVVAKSDVGRPAIKQPTVNTVRQTSTMGSESLDLEPMHTYPMAGREVIVDENLSPKLIQPLEQLGIKIKSFPKGTLDPDIINYAKQGKSIVLTNNIKDFKNSGVRQSKLRLNSSRIFRLYHNLCRLSVRKRNKTILL